MDKASVEEIGNSILKVPQMALEIERLTEEYNTLLAAGFSRSEIKISWPEDAVPINAQVVPVVIDQEFSTEEE